MAYFQDAGEDDWFDPLTSFKDHVAKNELQDSYNVAKAAKVGSVIVCPSCGNKTVKTTYHKVFCSNGKKRKGGNCKDSYWNRVDPTRQLRARHYA